MSSKKHQRALEIIDSWLEYQSRRFFIPGFGVSLVSGKETTWSRAYGLADIDKHIPATAGSVYRIASISKVFTTILLMQLTEEGRLQLDDKIIKHLPWLNEAKDKAFEQVSVRQVMSHSAGILRDAGERYWEDQPFPDQKSLQRQALAGIGVYTANERFKYSNFGYGLLGMLIEAITGQTYAKLLQTKILSPIGMADTYPDYYPGIKNLATGYSKFIGYEPRQAFGNEPARALAPAAGICTTPADLGKFMRALYLSNSSLLKPTSKREMQRLQWVDKEKGKDKYCLGMMVWEHEGKVFVGHDGGERGFITRMFVDTKNELGIAVLTNAIDGIPAYLSEGIHHIWKKVNGISKQPAAAVKQDYNGRYYGSWGDVELAEVNGSYYCLTLGSNKPFEDGNELEYVEPDTFLIKTGAGTDNIGEELKLERDQDGQIVRLMFGPVPLYPWKSKVKPRA